MSSNNPVSTSIIKNSAQSMGFFKNAVKNKHSFIQLLAMTGIGLLSLRSVGQKYKFNSLQEDIKALKEEQEGLVNRINGIKKGLLDEAAKESSGVFANRLNVLFGDGKM